jgi:hypothetical protein
MAKCTAIVLAALTLVPLARIQEKAKTAGDGRTERVAALEKEFDDARSAFSKAWRAAKTDEEKQKLVRPDSAEYAARFWELVKADPKDDAAFEALSWIVEHQPSSKDVVEAVAALEKDHVKNKGMGDLCSTLGGVVAVDSRLLERVAAENPVHDVQGNALYAVATHRLQCASTAKSIRGLAEKDEKGMKEWVGEERFAELKRLDVDRAKKEAADLLDRVTKEFSDVSHGNSKLGELAAADLHELRDLAEGKPAPEIEGEDLAGAKMKLSEFRGKVVLLDFWGNW